MLTRAPGRMEARQLAHALEQIGEQAACQMWQAAEATPRRGALSFLQEYDGAADGRSSGLRHGFAGQCCDDGRFQFMMLGVRALLA